MTNMKSSGVTENTRENVHRIIPPQKRRNGRDRESERTWGFADSKFEVSGESIVFNTERYPVGGKRLDNFAPFIEHAVGIPFDPQDRHQVVEPVISASVDSSDLYKELSAAFFSQDENANKVSIDPSIRLRRAHGHHLEEIYRVLFERIDRIPDLVVFPETDADVQSILALAVKHNALVIPYGGGTCVTQALECIETDRAIISLDMSRMDRVQWIDTRQNLACIEGGAVGRVLEEDLRQAGYTLGHEPDSMEFSTMGGWIATAASGMKKNRYGNIEDILVDVTVVTPGGVVSQPGNAPRTSHGLDMRKLMLGSEGMLGVITRCVVKIHKAPQVQRYGSLVFPAWEQGLAFMERISSLQAIPASVRLVDNLQFQFGRALKPASGSSLAQTLQKLFVTQIHGVDLEKMVACTLVYEGEDEEQRNLENRIGKIAKSYGVFGAGSSAGKDGYNLTFGIAYIRDFLLQYWVMGDSFETSVPWGKVNLVIESVKQAVHKTHQELSMKGRPFVTARVSQVYQSGCCVYFYIGAHYKGLSDPVCAFRQFEQESRQAILDAGGSLSHHHGVGKARANFLPRVQSAEAARWARTIQKSLDPHGVFASGNQNI